MIDAKMQQDILNAVYLAASQECEGREMEGKLAGNGHHMAQKIVQLTEEELVRRGIFTAAASDGKAL